MLPQTELAAYESAINLPLLNHIIAFVRDMSKADKSKRTALRQSCIFLDADAKGTAFQEKYGFLYLGELLERYEERFGMSVQDFRAIALAMGYTRDMTDDSMFIGPQRRDFLRQLTGRASGDVYLTGALYLLNKDTDAANVYEKTLYEANYTATEEAIFAMSLLQDQEQVFSRFKPLLLRLLGSGRTVPVLGNMKVLDWFIAWLGPRIKKERGKDMALFRALVALPVSFVKPDSKHYIALLSCGWTSLEIAYANMMSVLSQSANEVLSLGSLVTEKIVVRLFQEALSGESTLSPAVYTQLSDIFIRFSTFRIKYNGCEYLKDALKDGGRIQNPDTFLWFTRFAEVQHPAFRNFDILDAKWDALAPAMDRKKYIDLFEASLTGNLDAPGLRERIERYNALTGSSYLSMYWEGGIANRFHLLVDKGVLDLWQCFQDSLDSAGLTVKTCMIRHIRNYICNLSTIQAYQFYENFFKTYPVLYLERYFTHDYRNFYNALANARTYNSFQHGIKLKIQRDFLDDGQKRQLLKWLEEYIFTFEPDQYLPFAEAILRDEEIAGLFPIEDQQALFHLVIHQPNLFWQTANELKQRYMSEEELQAERDAKAAAEQEAARQKEQDRIQQIRDSFTEKFNGTFASIADFLNDYGYRREESPIACRIVHEHLCGALEEKSYELDGKDAVQFLRVCAELARKGAMAFSEAQTYISAVKERVENAE